MAFVCRLATDVLPPARFDLTFRLTIPVQSNGRVKYFDIRDGTRPVYEVLWRFTLGLPHIHHSPKFCILIFARLEPETSRAVNMVETIYCWWASIDFII